MGIIRKSAKSKPNLDRDMLWNMIKDSKIPVLTLDARWNTLFDEERKNPEIKKLVTRLYSLLKEQGGAVKNIVFQNHRFHRVQKNIIGVFG